MNRIVTGAAVTALLIASSTAFAATTTPSVAKSIDFAARCKSLGEQWKSAETTNAANANLGKAKGDAEKGAKLCASAKAGDHKKGAADYEAALKLLGVTPT